MTFSLCYSDDNKKNIFNNGVNNEYWFKQESIPIGCIPLVFLIPGGTPLDKDPPRRNIRQEQRLPEGTWDQGPDRK